MKILREQQPVSITNAFEVLSTHTHIEQTLDPANKASTKSITTPHKGIERERISAKAWVLESFGQKAPTPVIEPVQNKDSQQLLGKENNNNICDVAITNPGDNNSNMEEDKASGQGKREDNSEEVDVDEVECNVLAGSSQNEPQENECRAIILLPTAVQTDESQMQKESPNKVLHDIISHNMEELEMEVHEQQFIEGLEPVISAGALFITNDADVSPRIMKSGPFDTTGAFLLLTLAVVAILMKSYFDRDCLS